MGLNLFSPKFRYWIKHLTRFVSVQILIQALGFACGIILVRTLSKEEYAYFTLANSTQGAMNVLADSGVSSALSAIGGKVWQNPYSFKQLINTGLRCRRYLLGIAIIIVTPIVYLLLLQNKASIGYSTILVVGIIIELDFYLRISVLSIVLQLRTQLQQIEQLGLLGSFTRLVLLFMSMNILNAGIGVCISTISSGLQVLFLNRLCPNFLKREESYDEINKKEIWSVVKKQLPNSIFFCIQGQIVFLLASIFGGTNNLAEISALSRLSIVFILLGSILTNIVLPDFSRCQSSDQLLIKYLRILMIYLGISFLIVALANIFPAQILWVLGEQYSNLGNDIVTLMVTNASIHCLSNTLWAINYSKGWIELAWLFPPVIIFTQIVLLLVLDLSVVSGVIMFSMFSIIPATLINFPMTFKGLKQHTS
jgi:O-antigen/teichoic acid export membrane protein